MLTIRHYIVVLVLIGQIVNAGPPDSRERNYPPTELSFCTKSLLRLSGRKLSDKEQLRVLAIEFDGLIGSRGPLLKQREKVEARLRAVIKRLYDQNGKYFTLPQVAPRAEEEAEFPSRAQLAEYRLEVSERRVFQGQTPFDTYGGLSGSVVNHTATVVMDADGEVFGVVNRDKAPVMPYGSGPSGRGRARVTLRPNGLPYYFHHSHLLQGREAAWAGEVVVVAGTLKVVSIRTGHYFLPPWMIFQLLDSLERMGLDTSELEFEWITRN